MLYIPRETLDLIRNRSNILDIVRRYLPEIKKKGNNYVGLCPFHKEKTPSFTVSQEKQIFYCFGCKKGGNIFSFISEIERLNFPKSAVFLADIAGIDIKDEDSETRSRSKEYFRINVYAKNFFHKYLQSNEGIKGKKYIQKRGIKEELVDIFELGYSPDSWDLLAKSLKKYLDDLSVAESIGLIKRSKNRDSNYLDKFRNRIIFPIYDISGKIAGFGGRAIDDGLPKYLNSPDSNIFKKGNILYGLNIAKDHIADLSRAILVEGYFDVIACHQAGIKNVVAPMGTALTVEQAKLLSRYCSEIVVLFDSDEAGIKAAMKSTGSFENVNVDVKIAVLYEGDPFDFITSKGARELMAVVDSAVNPVDFKITQILQEKGSTNRNAILTGLFSVIRGIKLKTEQSIYLKKISLLLSIDEASIRHDYSNFIKNGALKKSPVYNKSEDIKYSNIEKGYEDLIRLICNFPELIEKAAIDFSISDIPNQNLSNIFERIMEIYFSDQKFSVDKMFDFFDDGMDIKFLHESLFNQITALNPGSVYNEIYASIRIFSIDKKIKKYADIIKSSDPNIEISEYLTEIDILRREKEKLSSYKFDPH